MSYVSVLVIDDEPLVADAIATLCERVRGVCAVTRAYGGHEGIKLIEQLVPDVAIVDVLMPNISGIEVADHVRQRGLRTRLILFSGCSDATLCRRALRAGAAGYLLKTSTLAELPIALHAVARGESYITPQLAKSLVHKPALREPSAVERLTARPREVLRTTALTPFGIRHKVILN